MHKMNVMIFTSVLCTGIKEPFLYVCFSLNYNVYNKMCTEAVAKLIQFLFAKLFSRSLLRIYTKILVSRTDSNYILYTNNRV